MGFLDKLKGKKDKAVELAKQHDDKIDQGIEKASDLANKATKGKYADKIDGAAEKAKGAYEKDESESPAPAPAPPTTEPEQTPPAPPAPPPPAPPTPSAPQAAQTPPDAPEDPQP